MAEKISIDVGSFRLSLRVNRVEVDESTHAQPVIVAIHGGGFSSAYFDMAEYSLLDRAERAGIPAAAVDRFGYGDSTSLPERDHAILENAVILNDALTLLWKERWQSATGIVVVGHSIGSAVALHLATMDRDWPLLGVSVSGVGVRQPARPFPYWEHGPEEWLPVPPEVKTQVMFGVPGSFAQSAADQSNAISQPIWSRELIEICSAWPAQAADVASRVTVPVQYRQGDSDHLWEEGPDHLEAFSRTFTNSPLVDAKLVENSGHCIDFHHAGEATQREQIDFAVSCASRAKESGLPAN